MEAKAIHDFHATADDELSFKRGSILKVFYSYEREMIYFNIRHAAQSDRVEVACLYRMHREMFLASTANTLHIIECRYILSVSQSCIAIVVNFW